MGEGHRHGVFVVVVPPTPIGDPRGGRQVDGQVVVRPRQPVTANSAVAIAVLRGSGPTFATRRTFGQHVEPGAACFAEAGAGHHRRSAGGTRTHDRRLMTAVFIWTDRPSEEGPGTDVVGAIDERHLLS